MIPQADRRIKRVSIPEIEGNYSDYLRIVEDMRDNAGHLLPDPNWLLADDVSHAPETYDKEVALASVGSKTKYSQRFSKMSTLLAPWIGNDIPATPLMVGSYAKFLESCDVLGLWQANILDGMPPTNFYAADLGSIMDLNLLFAFCERRGRPTNILEVGGGYGRLAEAAFNVFGRSIKYVMVDAVPASLYYSHKYLAKVLPAATIRSYYDEPDASDFQFDRNDISIVPAWHFERLNRLSYDVCVNIESMQEMNQQHVDHYLKLFNCVVKPRATIYVSNSHEYYFRGVFRYPSNWQLLYRSNTPRSWTNNHPTEIFLKGNADFSVQNSAVISAYQFGLWQQLNPDNLLKRTSWQGVMLRVLAAAMRDIRSRLAIRSRLKRLIRHERM